MIVKNIVKKTIELLGLKDLLVYFDSDNSDIDNSVIEEIENFVIAVNMANNNIASNYIELVTTSKVLSVSNKKIPYSQITDRSIIEIKKVTDSSGNDINYKLDVDGLCVDLSSVIVEYSYFPDMVSIDDEINYYTKVNELLFAQAVAGEYLFIKGDIDDAYMWDKRFKQSIFGVLRPKRKVTIPARRWY